LAADSIWIQEMGSKGWRKQIKEFHNLMSLPNIIRMTKSKWWRWMHGREN